MTIPVTGETWGEDVERVRAYLLAQSEQPLEGLRSSLDAAHTTFRTAIDGVSDDQAQFTPAVGEGEDAWGIAEVLRHIASIEPIMTERVRLLATGQSVESLTSTHPGYLSDVDTRRLADLLSALDQSYAALVQTLAAVDGVERLDTLVAHRRFGELNCRGWVAMHTLHLQDHARQIGKIKHLDGYPAM